MPEGDIVALVAALTRRTAYVSADTLSSEPEAGIAPVIADDQPVEETAPAPEMTLDELDEHIANDTVSFLPRARESGGRKRTGDYFTGSCAGDPARKAIRTHPKGALGELNGVWLTV